jgi:hypothetical protein
VSPIFPRQPSPLRSELDLPDLGPWLFARLRPLALRAINSPALFPNAASSRGAMSLAASRSAMSRSTPEDCFDGLTPEDCFDGLPRRGIGSPFYTHG